MTARADLRTSDTHREAVGAGDQTGPDNQPRHVARVDQICAEDQVAGVGAGDHYPTGSHAVDVARADQTSSDGQVPGIGANQDRPPHGVPDNHGSPGGPVLADPFLGVFAAEVADLERTRIAAQNRLRQLTRSGPDKDGEERGYGLPGDHPAVRDQTGLVLGALEMEKRAVAVMTRRLRSNPLYPWIEAQKGAGDKQAARLLGVIGDPYWNHLEGRPRPPAELWQYCGHGDPARSRRRKGQRIEYNPEAKMRVHLIAEKLVISGIRHKIPITRWGEIYYARKAATEGHRFAGCLCGEADGACSDGHRNNDALRYLGKRFLLALWREARRLHGADQLVVDNQVRDVGPVNEYHLPGTTNEETITTVSPSSRGAAA